MRAPRLPSLRWRECGQRQHIHAVIPAEAGIRAARPSLGPGLPLSRRWRKRRGRRAEAELAVRMIATGWDIGGAHIKVVQVDGAGCLRRAIQRPCTLWRGLEHLETALAALDDELLGSALHGVTMTGELVDLFADRAEGVGRLIEAMQAHYPGGRLRFYAGEAGFLSPHGAAAAPRQV